MDSNFTTRTKKTAQVGFTLVELLVVIGIIALLISILLPSLASARRQAMTLKCASNLRQIGVAYTMYATDNRGWFPPAKLVPEGSLTYSLPKLNYTATSAQPYWWYNFISKYVSEYNYGTYGVTSDTSQTYGGVLWCPVWANNGGYSGAAGGITSTSGGMSPSQPGYGINLFPLFTPNSPIASAGNMWPVSSTDVETWKSGSMGDTANGGTGQFWPSSTYSHPSERALCTDSIFWINLSMYIAKGDTPTPVPAFLTNNLTTPAQSEGQTWADVYRHGVYPQVSVTGGGQRGVASTIAYAPTGGKVSYNILFCDGHVITSNQKSDAFLYFRMKYPG